MPGVTNLRSSPVAWLLSISIMLLQSTAAVPRLEMAVWNKAYKLTVGNIDMQTNQQYNMIGPTCTKSGYDSNAAAAALDSCFYKQHPDGTCSKWMKKPGDWRINSNCYCYALNVYKGGFCIPGFHTESVIGALKAGEPKSCELMTNGLLADGAQHASREQALSAQAPPVGHYVGLLVRKQGCIPAHCWNDDFHLVRRDASGFWSWKEAGGPVQALDVHGQLVSDPEAATIPGRYDTWCGYFLVNPANMTIGGNFDYAYSLQDQVKFLTAMPGITVALHATPYNHTVDGAPDKISAKWLAQTAEWSTKQNTQEWNDFYNQQKRSQNGGLDEHFARQRQPVGKLLPGSSPSAAARSPEPSAGNYTNAAAPINIEGRYSAQLTGSINDAYGKVADSAREGSTAGDSGTASTKAGGNSSASTGAASGSQADGLHLGSSPAANVTPGATRTAISSAPSGDSRGAIAKAHPVMNGNTPSPKPAAVASANAPRSVPAPAVKSHPAGTIGTNVEGRNTQRKTL